jgi:hypothetical protein
MLSQFTSALHLLLLLSVTSLAQECKSYPGDDSWPNLTVWQSLNETISGRLIKPSAVGAVCYPSNPSFNNDTCTSLLAVWTNTSFIALNPFLPDYNDESCPPDAPGYNCSTKGYPAYVINATNAADVQAGVNFARERNIRLVIKGTGHDYPGRSSGAGSLSIWTHNLRGIEVALNDPLALRYGGAAAVKVAAGHQFREIHAEVAKHNVTVVGGADPTVGIGGWILNGGHSPISGLYGLGADQVLSIEVVTADGRHLTVNETSEPELFWAVRGGGGSTYAVMLSVTVKAYPQIPAAYTRYSLVTTPYSETLYSLLAYLHTQVPAISEAGGMGYHYVVPRAGPNTSGVEIITGIWFFPHKTIEEMDTILDPIYTAINSSSWAIDSISLDQTKGTVPEIMSFYAQISADTTGVSGRYGSWLLDGPSLTQNFSALKEHFKAATPQPWLLISLVIAGPGTRNSVATIPGGSNAVLPAWRKAYAHVSKSYISQKYSRSNETLY